MSTSKKASVAWRKVLYEKQCFPDNHVDPASFLSALRRSPATPKPELRECLLSAGRLSQELSLCCLCASLFFWLDLRCSNTHQDWWLPLPVLLTLITVLAITIYGLFLWNQKNVRHLIGNTCVFLLFGFGFSPVLKNLTSTISTDTVYAMVSMACLVHLFVQDYGVQAPLVSTTLAFNASLFAAVCLASRLGTIMQAFTLLTFCAAVFAGSPLMHRLSMHWSRPLQLALSLTLVLGAITSVTFLSYPDWHTPCLLLIGLILFLNGFCPWLYHRFQTYKENIFGPWDEAVVHHALN